MEQINTTNTDTIATTTAPADDVRACTRCKGVGTYTHAGFTSLEGKVYPDTTYTCHSCKGEKTFTAPDAKAIIALITTGRKGGESGRRMRASWPAYKKGDDTYNRYENRTAARAYYVWRLARFHGGKDMTLPMTADVVCGGDPFKKELDTMSEEVAKHVFGTDMAAANRWHRALYGT